MESRGHCPGENYNAIYPNETHTKKTPTRKSACVTPSTLFTGLKCFSTTSKHYNIKWRSHYMGSQGHYPGENYNAIYPKETHTKKTPTRKVRERLRLETTHGIGTNEDIALVRTSTQSIPIRHTRERLQRPKKSMLSLWKYSLVRCIVKVPTSQWTELDIEEE